MARLDDKRVREFVGPEGQTNDIFLWDPELKGFGVRLSAGGKKSFVVQGRVKGGKELRATIGPVSLFTTDDARKIAQNHLRTMRAGLDPRAATGSPSVKLPKGDRHLRLALDEARRQLSASRIEIEKLTSLIRHIEEDRSAMRAYIAELTEE